MQIALKETIKLIENLNKFSFANVKVEIKDKILPFRPIVLINLMTLLL